ncbi:MAG: hypothetical protein WCS96_06010 [Victivallales bacterium]
MVQLKSGICKHDDPHPILNTLVKYLKLMHECLANGSNDSIVFIC